MSSPADVAYHVLKLVPVGSLLSMDYEPVEGTRDVVRQAALVFGMDPRTYFVELIAVWRNAKGEPLIRGKVLNRGGEARTFNPIQGTLSRLDVLRLGPAPNIGARV